MVWHHKPRVQCSSAKWYLSISTKTPQINLVRCKWICCIKWKPDGSIERYKARLVAKGFHQQPRINYGDTFSPVVKPTTIRIVFSIVVSSNWCIKQLDITNAFLHGFLQENVFMIQPQFYDHHLLPDHVCHLKKSLYGLKQAPRKWFSHLSFHFHELGFEGSRADTLLFLFGHGATTIFIIIYMDDIIVTEPNPQHISRFISKLQANFPIN